MVAFFNFQRAGAPSPTTAPPLRFRKAARMAACRSIACLRVASGGLSRLLTKRPQQNDKLGPPLESQSCVTIGRVLIRLRECPN